MIISCTKCNKKFEVADELIPDLGRIVQCGSCAHQWHYVPVLIVDKKVEQREFESETISKEPVIFDKIDGGKIEKKKDKSEKLSYKPVKKKINFLSFLIVSIITFIALILLADTLKKPFSIIIPNLDFYLNSLYETLIDIFLFFNSLIK